MLHLDYDLILANLQQKSLQIYHGHNLLQLYDKRQQQLNELVGACVFACTSTQRLATWPETLYSLYCKSIVCVCVWFELGNLRIKLASHLQCAKKVYGRLISIYKKKDTDTGFCVSHEQSLCKNITEGNVQFSANLQQTQQT